MRARNRDEGFDSGLGMRDSGFGISDSGSVISDERLPYDLPMRGNRGTRIVYSTDVGRVCPTCGWPANDCRCSTRAGADEPVPARIVARLRVEKTGRGGKTVSVVHGLPRNAAFLKELCQEL